MAKLVLLAIRGQNVLSRLSVTGPRFLAAPNRTRNLAQHHYYAAAWVRHKDNAKPCRTTALGGVFSTSVPLRCIGSHKEKVPPTKPLHFDYSGDLDTSLPAVDFSLPKPGFENVPELKDADEAIQKIFSLEFGDGRDLRLRRIQNLVEKVKEHPAEIKTLEVKIAVQTVLIRNQMKHILEFRKDKAGKARLVERIQARKKLLKILRQLDFEKFEWLLQELKIKYVPTPQYNRKESKRAMRKRLAFEEGKAIRRAKLEEFREKLEEEKVKFLQYKEEEMKDIQQQLEELGITEISSLKDTLAALGMSHIHETEPPPIKRRTVLLRKKFELYGLRSRIRGKQAVTK